MDRYCKSGIMQTGKSLFLAAGMVALIGMALGVGDTAEAAIASEPGFGLAGTVHRGNGAPLQTANPAGMPATVADFLAGEGRDAATVNSLRVAGEGRDAATVNSLRVGRLGGSPSSTSRSN